MKTAGDFPLLSKKINGKKLIYLDSAATALKPWPVIERLSHFYSYETANVHRGAHFLADQATVAFEQSREAVRAFINAGSTDEIIFTKGSTESANLLAQTWAKAHLQPGDEILLTEMEHHANIVPWQMIAAEKSAKVIVAKITNEGDLDLNDVRNLLSARTKIFAFTACSNVLGTIPETKKLIALAQEHGALTVVDAAQLVVNRAVDVQDLNCDFLYFSGHKIFGPYGIGVLYGKKKWLAEMPPYQGGGSMIAEVTFAKTTYNIPPYRFEAGTPNISAVIALQPALQYVQKLGWPAIIAHENELLHLATSQMQEIPGLKIFGQAKDKAAILSFTIEGTHPADVGEILNQENIAVRVGHHCAQPLMRRLGVSGTIRASFSVFNQSSDVEALVAGLKKAKEMLS